MGYVAGKTQKIERPIGSGNYIEVHQGDAIPECIEWPTFKACLNTGFVIWMPDENAHVPAGVTHTAIAQAHEAGIVKAEKKKAAKKKTSSGRAAN